MSASRRATIASGSRQAASWQMERLRAAGMLSNPRKRRRTDDPPDVYFYIEGTPTYGKAGVSPDYMGKVTGVLASRLGKTYRLSLPKYRKWLGIAQGAVELEDMHHRTVVSDVSTEEWNSLQPKLQHGEDAWLDGLSRPNPRKRKSSARTSGATHRTYELVEWSTGPANAAKMDRMVGKFAKQIAKGDFCGMKASKEVEKFVNGAAKSYNKAFGTGSRRSTGYGMFTVPVRKEVSFLVYDAALRKAYDEADEMVSTHAKRKSMKKKSNPTAARKRRSVARKGSKAVPSYIRKTSRSAASRKYVFPGRKSYPIGDLYHARLALIYAMSPTNRVSRPAVIHAVAAAYPQYRWSAWWNKEIKKPKKDASLKTWGQYLKMKSGVAKRKRNPVKRKNKAVPSLTKWQKFQKKHGGKGHSVEVLSALYCVEVSGKAKTKAKTKTKAKKKAAPKASKRRSSSAKGGKDWNAFQIANAGRGWSSTKMGQEWDKLKLRKGKSSKKWNAFQRKHSGKNWSNQRMSREWKKKK